jgi:hypothetical protein
MASVVLMCGLVGLVAANPLPAADPVSPDKWQATFNTDLPADPVTGACHG